MRGDWRVRLLLSIFLPLSLIMKRSSFKFMLGLNVWGKNHLSSLKLYFVGTSNLVNFLRDCITVAKTLCQWHDTNLSLDLTDKAAILLMALTSIYKALCAQLGSHLPKQAAWQSKQTIKLPFFPFNWHKLTSSCPILYAILLFVFNLEARSFPHTEW